MLGSPPDQGPAFSLLYIDNIWEVGRGKFPRHSKILKQTDISHWIVLKFKWIQHASFHTGRTNCLDFLTNWIFRLNLFCYAPHFHPTHLSRSSGQCMWFFPPTRNHSEKKTRLWERSSKALPALFHACDGKLPPQPSYCSTHITPTLSLFGDWQLPHIFCFFPRLIFKRDCWGRKRGSLWREVEKVA